MLTRAEAAELTEAIWGACVVDAKAEAGVLVIELHDCTDDSAKRIVVSIAHVVVDSWPWPE